MFSLISFSRGFRGSPDSGRARPQVQEANNPRTESGSGIKPVVGQPFGMFGAIEMQTRQSRPRRAMNHLAQRSLLKVSFLNQVIPGQDILSMVKQLSLTAYCMSRAVVALWSSLGSPFPILVELHVVACQSIIWATSFLPCRFCHVLVSNWRLSALYTGLGLCPISLCIV